MLDIHLPRYDATLHIDEDDLPIFRANKWYVKNGYVTRKEKTRTVKITGEDHANT